MLESMLARNDILIAGSATFTDLLKIWVFRLKLLHQPS